VELIQWRSLLTVTQREPFAGKGFRRMGILVVGLAAAVIAIDTASARTGDPPPGLSNRGRALWNFEALLHDKFGNRPVCTRSGSLNFVVEAVRHSRRGHHISTSSRPHAIWLYHVVARRPRGSFGNYPVLVCIAGEFVSCGPRDRMFLIEYSDAAAFTVDCIAPLP
jgi:hypothetical protein